MSAVRPSFLLFPTKMSRWQMFNPLINQSIRHFYFWTFIQNDSLKLRFFWCGLQIRQGSRIACGGQFFNFKIGRLARKCAKAYPNRRKDRWRSRIACGRSFRSWFGAQFFNFKIGSFATKCAKAYPNRGEAGLPVEDHSEVGLGRVLYILR
jgi:hypothetical protein